MNLQFQVLCFVTCLIFVDIFLLNYKMFHSRSSFSEIKRCTLRGRFIQHSFYVSSLGLPLFAAMFMAHGNGDNKGNPRDDTFKACWMKQTIQREYKDQHALREVYDLPCTAS